MRVSRSRTAPAGRVRSPGAARHRGLTALLACAVTAVLFVLVPGLPGPGEGEGSDAAFTGSTGSALSLRTVTLSAPSNVNCFLSVMYWDPVPYATEYYIQKPIGSTTTANTSIGLALLGTYKITAKVGGWSSPVTSVSVFLGLFC